MPAKSASASRIAVVGASTSAGSRLREELVRFGVPGSRVDLYGATQGEALLSEYDGEARLIQEPEPAEIGKHDVVFICEHGELASSIARAAPRDSLVIDLVGGLNGEGPHPLVHPGINPGAARGHHGCLAVPHPLSILLVEILEPLERELGLDEVVAVVLRPASDFGEPGIDELREQTVRLLNFAEMPVDTFGRQLAFNIIPQRRLPVDPPGLQHRVARDVAELLDWDRDRLTLRLLAAPVFYGHCVQLRVRCRREVTVSRIEEVLADRSVTLPSADGAGFTPMDVSSERTTSLFAIEEDGLGGFWLQAVAGEADAKGAEQAVRLADELCGL